MPTSASEALHFILTELGVTIAAAESLTCGGVQGYLGSCSGSSAYFKGGITAYSLDGKVEMLGVDGLHAVQSDCVSKQVAQEMAAGVRTLFASDIGVSTTGYAEKYVSDTHAVYDGGCGRCDNQDAETCETEPYAWLGFCVFETRWERLYVPDVYELRGSLWSNQDVRDNVQEATAHAVIEHLIDWFYQIRIGNVPCLAQTHQKLTERGLFKLDLEGHPYFQDYEQPGT